MEVIDPSDCILSERNFQDSINVNQFFEDDLFNLSFAGVHDSDPLHGIYGFQRFCCTGRCSKRRENGIQPFLGGSVCNAYDKLVITGITVTCIPISSKKLPSRWIS